MPIFLTIILFLLFTYIVFTSCLALKGNYITTPLVYTSTPRKRKLFMELLFTVYPSMDPLHSLLINFIFYFYIYTPPHPGNSLRLSVVSSIPRPRHALRAGDNLALSSLSLTQHTVPFRCKYASVQPRI